MAVVRCLYPKRCIILRQVDVTPHQLLSVIVSLRQLVYARFVLLLIHDRHAYVVWGSAYGHVYPCTYVSVDVISLDYIPSRSVQSFDVRWHRNGHILEKLRVEPDISVAYLLTSAVES